MSEEEGRSCVLCGHPLEPTEEEIEGIIERIRVDQDHLYENRDLGLLTEYEHTIRTYVLVCTLDTLRYCLGEESEDCLGIKSWPELTQEAIERAEIERSKVQE